MRTTLLVLLAACRFSPAGVAGDGAFGADTSDIDAPKVIDAAVDAPIDARPIDAAIDGPVDSDGDGIPDAIDNCPTIPNANQRDFDGDGHGDVCDKCPRIASATDPDTDGDGVGDACDPRPGIADKLVYWSGFYDDADLAGWTITGTWTVANHALVQTSTTTDVSAFPPVTVTNGVVSTAMTVTGFGQSASFLVPSAGPVIANGTQVYSSGVFSFGGVQIFIRGNGIPRSTSAAWPEAEPGTPITLVMANGQDAVFTGTTTVNALTLGGGTGGTPGLFNRLASASFAYLFIVDEP